MEYPHSPYHIAFTGTRRGMTPFQKMAVHQMFSTLPEFQRRPLMLHHGNCVGADDDMDQIAFAHGLSTVIHPSNNPKFTASLRNLQRAMVVHHPKPPLERNHDIVDACATLIATPGESQERLRSGTWATIRYARKCGIRILHIWPDGRVTEREVAHAHAT